MNHSQRLGLPLLAPGQSQELFHNEALQMLDLLVAAAVEEGPRNDPPAAPAAGQSFIAGAMPTGDWSGEPGSLATFTEAGWRFARPVEGLRAWVKSTSTWAIFHSGAWELGSVRAERLMIGGVQVVGPRSAAVTDPAGGAVVDAEARSAIIEVLAALRSHGLIETE